MPGGLRHWLDEPTTDRLHHSGGSPSLLTRSPRSASCRARRARLANRVAWGERLPIASAVEASECLVGSAVFKTVEGSKDPWWVRFPSASAKAVPCPCASKRHERRRCRSGIGRFRAATGRGS